MKAFLDTHAAVFLWEGEIGLFGGRSRDLLERAALFVSPVVRLELRFLFEVGKLAVDADTILGGLVADVGLELAGESLAAVAAQAMSLSWTRDPFDRMIVATAALHRAPLITRDERMQAAYPAAAW